jgi:sugar phosphate isomerase/epimerase
VTPAELLGRRGERLRREAVGVELDLGNAWLPAPPALPSGPALRALHAALAEAPSVSAHGPHQHLDLVAPDPAVAAHARTSWRRAIRLCGALGVPRMVVHSGLAFRRDAASAERGLRRLLPVLREMAELAREEGVTLLLENTTELSPDLLRPVFEAVPEVGFCFDPAHVRSFALERDPATWLRELGAFWEHLHLSGTRDGFDVHLPLRDGDDGTEAALPLLAAPEGMPVVLETEPFAMEDVAWIARVRREAPWLRVPIG